MAGRPILEEVFGPVVGHPEKQFVLQHANVTIAIHRYFGRQKVERASATQPTEATPHHNASRVLHIPDGVALLVPAGQARPPHLLSPGINEAESALIAKHNGFPVRFTPGAVFFAEAEAFFDRLGRQQRLFCRAARGQAEPDLANLLDGPHRQVLPTNNLSLQFFRRLKGIMQKIAA